MVSRPCSTSHHFLHQVRSRVICSMISSIHFVRMLLYDVLGLPRRHPHPVLHSQRRHLNVVTISLLLIDIAVLICVGRYSVLFMLIFIPLYCLTLPHYSSMFNLLSSGDAQHDVVSKQYAPRAVIIHPACQHIHNRFNQVKDYDILA